MTDETTQRVKILRIGNPKSKKPAEHDHIDEGRINAELAKGWKLFDAQGSRVILVMEVRSET
jgi:hypothetical protein